MDIGIHGVCKVRAEAHSSTVQYNIGKLSSWLSHAQTFEFLDRDGKILGTLTLYLDNPDVAIPVGDLSRLIRENEPLLLEE